MDMKRYEKVTGDEALIKLLDGERIYNRKGNYWTRKGEGIFVNYEDDNAEYESTIPVIWFVDSTVDWYIKKPFDVRAEMLAQPNEWVGAYHDHHSKWIQVGFDAVNMRTRKAYYGYTGFVEGSSVESPTAYELETCIPIEDVPKEDFA